MKKIKAFTLIETLIYVGIFSIVALSLTGILWNTLRVNSNQQAANEVDENLRYIMGVLSEKVRSSTVVDAATSSTLVLKNSSYEDITFSVVDGVLYLQEGSAALVAVSSNKVLVDSLTFTKIEMAGAKDGVRVDITLSYNSDKAELAFSKNMISSINRVAAITFDSDLLPDTNNLYSIGADNPRWKNGYFSGDLYVTGNETLTGNLVVDTDTLYVDSANNRIGIGTTSPSYSLHIITASTTNASFVLNRTDAASMYMNASATRGNFGTVNDFDVGFMASSSLKMLIDSSTGYLGIGTSTPSEMLEVNGNIRLVGTTPTYKIKNVATPTDSSDVATKGYVDAAGTTYTQYVQYFATSGIETWTNPNGAASTTISVIVVGGGGGGGGGANSATAGSVGSTGGTSSFGALASATGGTGGDGGTTSAIITGGIGYNNGGTGGPGDSGAVDGKPGGVGGAGFQGCGTGGAGAGAFRGSGAGGGSGNVKTYYGVVTGASYTVTIGAGGAGGASSGTALDPGSAGASGCVIVYWWDN